MCLFFLVFFWCSIHKVQRVGLQDFEWFEGEEHWPSLFSSSLFVVLFVCLWPNVKTSHQQTIETLWHSKNIIAAVGKNFIDCKHSKTGVMCFGQVHCRGGSWSDPALPDGAPWPQQREHRGLQQQEVLAKRLQNATHEAWCQPVSGLPLCMFVCMAVEVEVWFWFATV